VPKAEAKTRIQLADEEAFKKGLLVPVWFELQSDGCSVPFGKVGRVMLQARKAKPVCVKHDFDYYTIAIQYPPGDERRIARMTADYTLKLNRKKVAKCSVIGRMYAWKYFRAVRAFGAQCVRSYADLQIPPTIEALDELITKHLDFPLTERAERKTNGWRMALEISNQ